MDIGLCGAGALPRVERCRRDARQKLGLRLRISILNLSTAHPPGACLILTGRWVTVNGWNCPPLLSMHPGRSEVRMSEIVITGDPQERRRLVSVRLPLRAWSMMETEADAMGNNLSKHVSKMLLTALRVRGYDPKYERLANRVPLKREDEK